MGKEEQKYIHNFARTVAGQLNIKSSALEGLSTVQEIATCLVRPHWDKIRIHLYERHSDATLGKLAACGRMFNDAHWPNQISLYSILAEVKGQQPDWSAGGKSILLWFATAALVGALAENIYADLKKAQDPTAHPRYNPGGPGGDFKQDQDEPEGGLKPHEPFPPGWTASN